jgi:integrase
LGIENEKIFRKPKIKTLDENNARQGFFEWHDFLKVRGKLVDYLKAPMTFAYFTGWRVRSEVLKMRRDQFDMDRGTAWLYVGTTKNKKARLIYLPSNLIQLLKSLPHSDIGPMFHNNGKPIRNYYKAWRKACAAAGEPAKIPHDFRRTAVRNLIRNGVDRKTAKKVTGHLTDSVFGRYNIVDERDLEAAAEKMGTILGTDDAAEERTTSATPQQT